MIADGKFAKELIDIIDAAENSLEFSIYFFHHTEIETALLRAHKRGVKIRGFIHHHDSFALSYVKRTRGTANRLLAGKIKDLHFGPGHLFTHSKYIIRDHEEILLGTGNWLHEDIKIHPQLYVRFTNPQLAKDLGKILARQIRNSQSVAELNPTIRS
jgi:phosphatidylserine/phosphatidylglycerophosphate/cardiolipin synthase-like enzyme